MDQTLIASIFSGSLWQIISSTSAFGLFILLILTSMSIVCWVIIFHKWRQFKVVDKDNHRFQHQFQRARQLSDSVGQAKASSNSPISRIYLSGYNELVELKEKKNQGGALQQTFMGLLGTVVGIMESFWAIGERGSASLAVVAPGIAEALLATIVGLGAAIPAVIAFNWANNKLKFINDFSSNFIMGFLSQAKKEER
jgi:biopolymer transport protein TolQ